MVVLATPRLFPCLQRVLLVGCALAIYSSPLSAEDDKNAQPPTLTHELQHYFVPVVKNLQQFYIDRLPADSLMKAGLGGVFSALDPPSEYDFGDHGEEWKANVDAFHRISSAVVDSALYTVGPDTLVRLGIHGMLSVLDPDTNFLEKRRLDQFIIETQGRYGGLGFRIQVIRPDSAIAVWSLLHDAAGLMRGVENTPVTLTVERAGLKEPIDITIVRERVQVKSVPYYGMLSDSVGYIKLSAFQYKCSDDVLNALKELKSRGATSLMFDMRDNRGGVLEEAVSIADFFLPPDRLVVYTAGRAFRDTTVHRTKKGQLFTGPIICLVNGYSASASEIVSGAIQDWDRGLVLGQPTTGKGSVQRTVPIGDDAELKLTVAAYFIPSGRSIDKRMRKDSTLVALSSKEFRTKTLGRIVRGADGITPDIVMDSRRRTNLFSQLAGWQTQDNKFFRFSRQYHLDSPDLTPDFVADEQVLDEFREFVEDLEFEYVSSLEARLEQFEGMLSEEDNEAKVDKPIKRLKEEIEKIEGKHWEADAEIIGWRLTYDTLDKNFGIEAAHAYNVTVDNQIQRSLEILSDSDEYNSWLSRPEVGLSDDDITASSLDSTAADPP